MAKRRVDRPLQVEVKDGLLITSIGVNTLAWAFDHCPDNNPYCDKTQRFVQAWKVSDVVGFALDIRHELLNEGEDGSTMLTRLLDKASEEAVDQGSLHITEGTEVE